MIQAKHCNLCEFPKKDLKIGLTCGLTDKKPDFETYCPDFKLSKSYNEYLPELLNQIEKTKRQRAYVYLEFFIYVVIGLTIMLGNRSRLFDTNLLDLSYSNFLYVMGTLLILLIGLFFITWGIRNIKIHREKRNKLTSKKREIELVLSNYKMDVKTILKK